MSNEKNQFTPTCSMYSTKHPTRLPWHFGPYGMERLMVHLSPSFPSNNQWIMDWIDLRSSYDKNVSGREYFTATNPQWAYAIHDSRQVSGLDGSWFAK